MSSTARRVLRVVVTALAAGAAFTATQIGAATAAPVPAPAPVGDGCSWVRSLEPGTFLMRGQFISSCNGENRLTFGSDGNVVLTVDGETTWQSGTAGLDNAERLIVRDGDLSIVDDGPALWELGLDGATRVQVSDGGELLFTRDGDVTGRIAAGPATEPPSPEVVDTPPSPAAEPPSPEVVDTPPSPATEPPSPEVVDTPPSPAAEPPSPEVVDTRPSTVQVRWTSLNHASESSAQMSAESGARAQAPEGYNCSLNTRVILDQTFGNGGQYVNPFKYDAETTGTCERP